MMKDTKPKPRATKLPLREPAKPLAQPEVKLPGPDHPIFNLIGPAKAAETATTMPLMQPVPPPTTHHPPPTDQPPPTTQAIAPTRDFVRVPNSVVRDALPAGLFKGESKKTYDALYQRTRGAVVPRRVIRATLSEVMDWADVSHNTLKGHLKHLVRVGLVKVYYVRGDNTGAEYEVFTPEETPPTTHHHPPPTDQPPSSQILGPPTTQNLVGGGWGQLVYSQEVNEVDNTSFNTNTEQNSDDEAFAKFLSALRTASREVTGREPSASDAERWAELADLLITELKIAAGRTSAVSSVPAFLTEHLRRRLWKKDKRQIEAEAVERREEQVAKVDAAQCPDCFGTGMYYPDGFEKGVAKCRHEKLRLPPETPR
ncbi:MAG TPA: hypothetical protein VF297_27360 [Pyrinomonadaceae bacterium]